MYLRKDCLLFRAGCHVPPGYAESYIGSRWELDFNSSSFAAISSTTVYPPIQWATVVRNHLDHHVSPGEPFTTDWKFPISGVVDPFLQESVPPGRIFYLF